MAETMKVAEWVKALTMMCLFSMTLLVTRPFWQEGHKDREQRPGKVAAGMQNSTDAGSLPSLPPPLVSRPEGPRNKVVALWSLPLVVVNDFARVETIGADNSERYALEIIAQAQQLLDLTNDGLGSGVRLESVGILSISSPAWWEQDFDNNNYYYTLHGFQYWVKTVFLDREISEFWSTERALPILLSGHDRLAPGAVTSRSAVDAPEFSEAAIVVNAAQPAIPCVAKRLAHLLTKSLGKGCQDPGETSELWKRCRLRDTLQSIEPVPIRLKALLGGKDDAKNGSEIPAEVYPTPGNGARCGNGIVDENEECDCIGLNCDVCCDQKSCTLKPGSECSSQDPCCEKGGMCRLAKQGRVCRAARDAECDTAEACDGKTRTCPPDDFQPTGTPCTSIVSFWHSEGSCLHGNCMPPLTGICESYRAFAACPQDLGDRNGHERCGVLECMRATFDENSNLKQDCAAIKSSKSGTDDLLDQILRVPDGTLCSYGNDQSEKGVCKGDACVSVSVLPEKLPASCSNEILDVNETDIDCGGPICRQCQLGEHCRVDSDCFALRGFENVAVCTSENQTDGITVCVMRAQDVQDEQTEKDVSAFEKMKAMFESEATMYGALGALLLALIALSCMLHFIKRERNRNQPGTDRTRNIRDGNSTFTNMTTPESSTRGSRAVVPDRRRDIDALALQIRANSAKKLQQRKRNSESAILDHPGGNWQPDEQFKWVCSNCRTQNHGLMARCDKCDNPNPADEQTVGIGFADDLTDEDEEPRSGSETHQDPHAPLPSNNRNTIPIPYSRSNSVQSQGFGSQIEKM